MFHRRVPPALTTSQAAAVTGSLRQWDWLDAAQQGRLLEIAADLLDHIDWEATKGFAIDEAMCGLVAGQAALLAVGLAGETFRDVRTVVIHPTTDVLRGPRPGPSAGVVSDGPVGVLGHTTARGPVFLAWDAAVQDAAHPGRGRNVVIHEFAHRLDAEDGWFDGMPSLASDELRREWIAVCEAEMGLLRAGLAGGLLRPYAATNPAEFFAVATETFFTRGRDLQAGRPALYHVLEGFYGLDTAAWGTTGVSPGPDLGRAQAAIMDATRKGLSAGRRPRQRR